MDAYDETMKTSTSKQINEEKKKSLSKQNTALQKIEYKVLTKEEKVQLVDEKNLVLAQEFKGPLQKKKRHTDTREKSWSVAKAKSGSEVLKILKFDEQVINLPPVSSCNVKNCNLDCANVVRDKMYQHQLRQLYCDTVRNAASKGHEHGNKLIAGMCRTMSLSVRNALKLVKHVRNPTVTCAYCSRFSHELTSPAHWFSEASCPNWNEAMDWYKESYKSVRHEYFLPTFDDDGMVSDSQFQVHKQILSQLFKINWKRFQTIYSLANDPFALTKRSMNTQEKRGGHNKISDGFVQHILAAPSFFPCLTSHYAAVSIEIDREYRYSADLSLFDFWKKALHTTGCDDAFIAQSKRMNFWPTYSNKFRFCPKKKYEEDKETHQLKPSFSYDFARKVYRDYNIKFDCRKCDICMKCFELRGLIANTQTSEEDRKCASEELLQHQIAAASCTSLKRHLREKVKASNGRMELIQMDYAANPRCPYQDTQDAFYKRILSVFCLVICSTLTDLSYMYMYDETTSGKGSDALISLLALFLSNHPYASTIEELHIWVDGCAGQSWNNIMVFFLEELVCNESFIHCKLLPEVKSITLYRPPRGHTYMQPDTVGGRVQRAARKVLKGRGKGAIHVMSDHPDDPPYTVSWQQMALSCDGLKLYLPTLMDFFDWQTFFKDDLRHLYKKPNRASCFRGPSAGKKAPEGWLISESHYLNFGCGATCSGDIVSHYGVIFSKQTLSQDQPDEVSLRRKNVMDTQTWESIRNDMLCNDEDEDLEKLWPKIISHEPNKLTPDKQMDLYEHGRHMSRDKSKMDFTHRYPKPDVIVNEQN